MLRRLIVRTSSHVALTPDLHSPSDRGQWNGRDELVVNARDACPAAATSRSRPRTSRSRTRVPRRHHHDGSVRDAGVSDTAAACRKDPAPPVRAVFHHEGSRKGHRPRAVDHLRHRQAEQGLYLGLQRTRARHDVQSVSAACGKIGGRHCPGHDRAGSTVRLLGDRPSGGRRSRRPPVVEADPRQRRLSRPRGGER